MVTLDEESSFRGGTDRSTSVLGELGSEILLSTVGERDDTSAREQA